MNTLPLTALIMNIYLLSRLFKIYNQNKFNNYRGPNKTYNAIIYAGKNTLIIM